MMIEPFGEVVEDSRNSRGPDLRDRARGHGRLKDPVTYETSSNACTQSCCSIALYFAYHRARPSRAINEDRKKKKKDPVLKVSVDCRWLLASQWMRLSDPGLNPRIHAYVSGNMRELCTHTQRTPILV